MSFTDQKPRIATEEDLKLKWSGGKPGERFRCYICGYKFIVGDQWRWVYGSNRKYKDANGFVWGVSNLITCAECDGPDVLDKWVAMNEELYKRFWWAVYDGEY